MVIYIDKTVGDRLTNIPLSMDEAVLFTALATSHQRGQCVLCGELNTIEQVAKSLGHPANAIYNRIGEDHAQSKSIMDEVCRVLVLCCGDEPVLPSFLTGKSEVLRVEDAVKWGFDAKCSLVCENIDDCRFYVLLGKRYCQNHHLAGINISVTQEPGGGHTIGQVLKKCVCNEKKLSLCICDADVKYGTTTAFPEPPQRGNTVRDLEKAITEIVETSEYAPFKLVVPEVHEIENLIPISIFDSIAKEKPDILSGVSVLKALKQVSGDVPILYYDLKKGINEYPNDPSREYWENIKSKAGVQDFPRLCNKLLEPALGMLEDRDQILTIEIDLYLSDIWEEIGLIIFTWGCGHQEIRS